LPAALNAGIKAAKGKYIARMDADDISLPQRLILQVNYLDNNQEVGIVGGQAYVIDENGIEIGLKRKPIGRNCINRSIEYACPIIHPTYMVRVEVYQKLDGYRVAFPIGQDFDFLLRAFDSGETLANIDQYLLYYRVAVKSSRPGRERYQMHLTRVALQLHRQRVKRGRENPNVFAKLCDRHMNASIRFSLANRYRNFLLLEAKQAKGFKYLLVISAVVLVSFADYELFCSSLRGGLYKRACVEN